MSEIVVRVKDKEKTGDPTIDCLRTMRGDVVEAMPDGHDWTPAEREHPDWVILKVPGMTLAEARSLTAQEPADPHRRHIHFRMFRLDLDHPDAHPEVKSIAERTRSGNVHIERIDPDHLRAIRKQKPPVADPDVIGTHTNPLVIG